MAKQIDTLPDRQEIVLAFGRIGLLSFGGPAAQIALMHRVLVDEKGWLSERQYLDALSFCMLLPGPEAMQLATYSGWRLHGFRGGLTAGLLFVVPGALVILALAIFYAYLGSVGVAATLFLGVKACVLIIVLEALLRIAKRALSGRAAWAIAAAAFIGIFFLALPFPLIVLCAAIFGYFRTAVLPDTARPPVKIQVSWQQTGKTVLAGLIIWWLPVLVLGHFHSATVLPQIGAFFSKLAVVTFGGAYAVLAYVAQDAVLLFDWLDAGEMMDGLGLAETTPGPLILVTEFVGFLAGFREGGLGLGLAGAALTLWVTFVPCFLWIFAGAPYIEWIASQPRLNGALSAITAAVVGVILNLSIWFGLNVLFTNVELIQEGPLHIWWPEWASLEWRAALLTLLSALALLKLKWSIPATLLMTACVALAV